MPHVATGGEDAETVHVVDFKKTENQSDLSNGLLLLDLIQHIFDK